MKNRIWIELDKPKNDEHGKEQCRLANNMLKRLGILGIEFRYNPSLHYKGGAGYELHGDGGTYHELGYNGEWFGLDFLGRDDAKTDRADAICTLIRESHIERTSKTALKRCQSAMRALGMSDSEQAKVLTRLEYADSDGNLHARFAEKATS